MLLTLVQNARVRNDIEWLLTQPVEFAKHGSLLGYVFIQNHTKNIRLTEHLDGRLDIRL